MKNNNYRKMTIGLVLTAALLIGSSITVFAAPQPAQVGAIPAVAATVATKGDFFLPKDSENYCYKIGDEVEVKIGISRGYFTVRCRITDRKSDWFNGNMYYVEPVGDMTDIQGLFFSAGWIHETDIQTINPQPYFKILWEFAKKKLLS